MWSSPNSLGLKQRGHLTSLRFWRSSTHALHFTSVSFGTVSSQPKSSLHSSCRRTLAGSIKGAANPRGSLRLDTRDRIPLLVSGTGFSLTRKLSVSASTSHWVPKARSIGRSSKSKLAMDGALSPGGISFNTSRLLLIHFVRWNPPLASNCTS